MIGCISFSHDGKLLAVGGENLTLWDVEKRKVFKELDAKYAWDADFSPDGKFLAVGLWGGELQIWDAVEGRLAAELDKSEWQMSTVAFGPDGKVIAAGSWDGSVRIWNANPPGLITTLRKASAEFVQDLEFSHDGKLLAVGLGNGEVQIWDTGKWSQIHAFRCPFSYSLSFSSDDRLLALGGYLEVQIRSTQNWDMVHSILEYNSGYWTVAFSPDGKFVAADSTVWDTKTLKPVHDLGGKAGVEAIAFSPDGRFLACGYADGNLSLWDVSMWESLATRKMESNMGVYSLAFSPDGKLLATGSWDRSARVWDMKTYKPIYELPHGGGVTSVAFSPDGRLLASGAEDGIIRLWDVKTKKLLMTMGGGTWVMCLSFSPNGRYLASGSTRILPRLLVETPVQIWDVTNGELAVEFKNLKGYTRAISFSPDGRLLAMASDAGVLSLWEMPKSAWLEVELKGKDITSWGKIKRGELYQNYPNPFNAETWIPFALAEDSYVSIEIRDATGKLVKRFDPGYKQGGDYLDKSKAVHWDGRNENGEEASGGLYFYTLKAGNLVATRKMVILR